MLNVVMDPLFFYQRSLLVLLQLVTVRFPYILSIIFIKSGKRSKLQIVHPLLSLKNDQLYPAVIVISYKFIYNLILREIIYGIFALVALVFRSSKLGLKVVLAFIYVFKANMRGGQGVQFGQIYILNI